MKHGKVLIPGLDPDFKEGDEQLHTVLLTAGLAGSIGKVMEEARVVISAHRDRMLDHPDQIILDRLEVELDEYGCGLGLLAAMAEAEPPSRVRRVPVAPPAAPALPERWTRSGMIKALCAFVETTGGDTRMNTYRRMWVERRAAAYWWPTSLEIRREFGTWKGAIEAAGLRYR